MILGVGSFFWKLRVGSWEFLLADVGVCSPSVIGGGLGITHGRAVGENNLVKASNRYLRLGLPDVQSDDVSVTQRRSGPAEELSRNRTAHFHRPMLDIALFVLVVRLDERVGIDP